VLFGQVDAYNTIYGPFDEFTHQWKTGINAELMVSLSERGWIGVELSSSGLKGYNHNPPRYNFQHAPDYNQITMRERETTDWISISPFNDSLQYNTSLINLLLNYRLFLATSGNFRPFIKIHGGVSFVGTELSYNVTEEWPPARYFWEVNGVPVNAEDYEFSGPVLYSRGTGDSEQGRLPALNLGGGLGFEYILTEKIGLYADFSYSFIQSNILDGRPNFDYVEPILEQFNTFGNALKLSFGITYTLGDNLNIIGSGSGGRSSKGGSKSGRQHPYLPFYEIKRPR
jgi:hypothetical protein